SGRSPGPGPGQIRSSPPGSASRPSRTPPDQQEPVPPSKEGNPGAVEPRQPGPPAGPPSYPDPKPNLRDLGQLISVLTCMNTTPDTEKCSQNNNRLSLIILGKMGRCGTLQPGCTSTMRVAST